MARLPEHEAISDRPPKHSVSVSAAIVDDDGRFLAIRRADNGRWEPPGGVLEHGESIEQGLVREVWEETGLTVEPLELTGVYKNMRHAIVALVFRCRVAEQEPTPTIEAREVRWITGEQVSELMAEAYAARLLDAVRPGRPHVRAHDGSRLIRS